ncbi:outer membrane beta-barrel protein [Fusobacterium sp. IOR10]|uniref:OmpW family outer membrane protein n=1 Tax=Fusobacterium sp. IOR10 TaxID=2665157 RepID=UPI0013D8195D|nr:outer membrane beta-barrel protein [Fusobacterium sp. IOR10]
MKKTILLLAALTVASASYAKEIMPVAEMPTETMAVAQSDMYLNVRVGGDIMAKYDKVYQGYFDDSTDGFGGEVALEGYKMLNDNVDVGLGLAYQFHADRDSKNGVDGVEYDSVPLYLTAKYNFITDSNIKPYLKANLGYSFNFNASDAKSSSIGSTGTSVDDGLYWAAGAGMEYNNFTVDLMYAVNKAESSADSYSVKSDNDYDRVVLSVGYLFDL